jgi:hypothetical protein
MVFLEITMLCFLEDAEIFDSSTTSNVAANEEKGAGSAES